MQKQIENTETRKALSYRTSQAIGSVALPYVKSVTDVLDGQKLRLNAKAKRVLTPTLPHINSVELNHEKISQSLREAIQLGVFDAAKVTELIDSFDDNTSASEVLLFIRNEVNSRLLADDMDVVYRNAEDIYTKLHQLGYTTDNLDVADIKREGDQLVLEFTNPLTIHNYDDTGLPYPVQLAIAAFAIYIGNLCGASPADHFIHYSEDFETLNSVKQKYKNKLLNLNNSLSDEYYIEAFINNMPEKELSEYTSLLEDYYDYFIEDEEYHADIADHIKRSIRSLHFINVPQLNDNNLYRINKSSKLLSRLNRLSKKYDSSPTSLLVTKLVELMSVAHENKTISTIDFEFDGDVYDLSVFHAITFKSIECDAMWEHFSESEKHTLETGDIARLIMELESPEFLVSLKNHQLGWLLQHCLKQLLKEYKDNV